MESIKTTPPATDTSVRCGDCGESCEYVLCLGCIARVYATPVDGERLPWDRARLVAELKDEASGNCRKGLALAALYIEGDDIGHPHHTAVCDGQAMEVLLRHIKREVRAVLDEDEAGAMSIRLSARYIAGLARLVEELARDMERAADAALAGR